METQQIEAQTALDAIADSRRRVADTVLTPRWYNPALGLLLGSLVAVQSTNRTWAIAVADVAAAVGIAVLVNLYRERTGVFPATKLRGAAARVRIELVATFLALYGIGAALELAAGLRGALAGAGAAIAVAVVVLGNRFDERLRAELRGEA
jgi:hypothetical protein